MQSADISQFESIMFPVKFKNQPNKINPIET